MQSQQSSRGSARLGAISERKDQVVKKGRRIDCRHGRDCLGVGALGLHVAGLLALVADLLAAAGVLGAVAGEVTSLAAVVALAAVDAIA